MDPLLVASIVELQRITRFGRARYIYGQVLLPQAYRLLQERVAAIEQQLKKQLITLASAQQQLTQLGIDKPEVDAMSARWEATLLKTPGAAQLINPYDGLLE